jgi:hypothetical protein
MSGAIIDRHATWLSQRRCWRGAGRSRGPVWVVSPLVGGFHTGRVPASLSIGDFSRATRLSVPAVYDGPDPASGGHPRFRDLEGPQASRAEELDLSVTRLKATREAVNAASSQDPIRMYHWPCRVLREESRYTGAPRC